VRNQDDEFNYRIRKHGGRILLSPRIKSTYTVRNTLGSLGHQYFQYGYWKVRVLQKHPRQMRPRQFVPPAFVAALLGAGTLACFLPLGRALAGLLVGTYLIANCIASLCSLHRGRVRDFWWLPIVFATLHLSYGLGFLAGLLRFWKRWKA
jgi:succinoglycan biosynthesis protein ExoA